MRRARLPNSMLFCHSEPYSVLRKGNRDRRSSRAFDDVRRIGHVRAGARTGGAARRRAPGVHEPRHHCRADRRSRAGRAPGRADGGRHRGERLRLRARPQGAHPGAGRRGGRARAGRLVRVHAAAARCTAACSRTAASATAISTTWTRATPCGPSWRTAGWRCSRIPASWTATICFPTWWNAVSAASNASIPTTPWRITLAVQSWLSVTASSARAAPTTTEGSAGFPMWGFAFRRRLREPSGALGRMPLRAQARRIGLGGRPAHRPLRPRDRPLRIDAAASCAPRSRPRTGGGSRALAVVRRPSTRYTGRHDARPLIDFAERP